MESVGQTLSHMNRARQFNYEDLIRIILPKVISPS